MGSTAYMDYVAHLGLVMGTGPTRIACAWAQSICAVFPDPEDREDVEDCDIAALTSPLAAFVKDVTGRQLHLASALTHSNMRPPPATRIPPMLRLGGMANKLALEEAVAVSRRRRGAATTIQRAFRRFLRRSRQLSNTHMGAALLGHLFAGLRVADEDQSALRRMEVGDEIEGSGPAV